MIMDLLKIDMAAGVNWCELVHRERHRARIEEIPCSRTEHHKAQRAEALRGGLHGSEDFS